MPDFLTAMAESSSLRARATKARSSVTGLTTRALSARPTYQLELSDTGFDLIAEAKLASPATGTLIAGGDPQDRVVGLASLYQDAGAAAVSVITEPSKFDGHLDHLEAAANVVDVPVMRKDFLVDPVQVVEARAAGASGVLIIARMVNTAALVEMTDAALGFGMFVLVELFEEADLDSASVVLDSDNVLVGVNTRDLTTLEVDSERMAKFAPLLPDHLPRVAESGVLSAEDAVSVATLGYRLALVGTGLVTTDAPGESTRRLISAGRTASSIGSPS